MLKNTRNKVKNDIENINIRLDITEDRLCEVEDRLLEIIQPEENKEKEKKM